MAESPSLPDLKRLLGEALLEEQKCENAFEASDRPMNRGAMFRACKAAWKAYDDALDATLARLERVEKALEAVRDRFFPADQPERDRDLMWDEVNIALAALQDEPG